jgi:hypothetical protein
MRQAAVDPPPGHAAIVAARHADAARGCEQRAVIQRRDRTDEHALQRAMLHGPALVAACEDRDTVDRAHGDGVGRAGGTLDVRAAIRQEDHELHSPRYIRAASDSRAGGPREASQARLTGFPWRLLTLAPVCMCRPARSWPFTPSNTKILMWTVACPPGREVEAQRRAGEACVPEMQLAESPWSRPASWTITG